MADASSGLMQPLWAPQPNIYNSGITRGGGLGDQKLVGIQMVLLRLIGAATKLLTTYRTLSDNKDTQTRNTYCKIIETHTFRM